MENVAIFDKRLPKNENVKFTAQASEKARAIELSYQYFGPVPADPNACSKMKVVHQLRRIVQDKCLSKEVKGQQRESQPKPLTVSTTPGPGHRGPISFHGQ